MTETSVLVIHQIGFVNKQHKCAEQNFQDTWKKRQILTRTDMVYVKECKELANRFYSVFWKTKHRIGNNTVLQSHSPTFHTHNTSAKLHMVKNICGKSRTFVQGPEHLRKVQNICTYFRIFAHSPEHFSKVQNTSSCQQDTHNQSKQCITMEISTGTDAHACMKVYTHAHIHTFPHTHTHTHYDSQSCMYVYIYIRNILTMTQTHTHIYIMYVTSPQWHTHICT